ncbi:unnamed protein product, partial [Staurois parvus]
QKEQTKCRQGTGQSTRDKIVLSECHFLSFSNFLPFRPRKSRRSQGTEPR